jgi:hypothetical protein
MAWNHCTWILGIIAIVSSGCTMDTTSDASEGELGEAELAQTLVNGHEMNGTLTNGNFVNGVKTNGVKTNGVKTNGLSSTGSTLQGTDEETGATITGTGHIGTTIVATLSDASQINVYISDVRTGEVPGMDTFVFKQDNAFGENICSGGTSAIVLNGVWNYTTAAFVNDSTQFSVACLDAALAKCVTLGYKREGTDSTTGVANSLFHDACVRMIRDDICGNGVSHTANGTLIDVWDKASIQTRTSDTSLKFQAEWGPNGATCYRHSRRVTGAAGNVASYILSNSAACGDNTLDANCGDTWRTGGLIRNASGINDYDTTSFNSWSW